MQEEMIKKLIEKYLLGQASGDETAVLDKWYHSLDTGEDIYTPGTMELKQRMEIKFLELKGQLNIE